MKNDAPSAAEKEPRADENSEEKFQLSPGLMVVGLIMVALGIACGLVMSSATFLR